MGIGEGTNSDTQESKKKVPKNFSKKLVRIGISVQIDSEGSCADFDTSKFLKNIFRKWFSKRQNSWLCN